MSNCLEDLDSLIGNVENSPPETSSSSQPEKPKPVVEDNVKISPEQRAKLIPLLPKLTDSQIKSLPELMQKQILALKKQMDDAREEERNTITPEQRKKLIAVLPKLTEEQIQKLPQGTQNQILQLKREIHEEKLKVPPKTPLTEEQKRKLVPLLTKLSSSDLQKLPFEMQQHLYHLRLEMEETQRAIREQRLLREQQLSEVRRVREEENARKMDNEKVRQRQRDDLEKNDFDCFKDSFIVPEVEDPTLPPCAHCGQGVAPADSVRAFNFVFHMNHFLCMRCGEPFEKGQFFPDAEKKPICINCYSDLEAVCCASCGEPIKGKMITVMNQSFHPEHFVCSQCQESLAGKEHVFMEDHGTVCVPCQTFIVRQEELQGLNKCGVCHNIFTRKIPWVLLREKKMKVCLAHLRCRHCGNSFETRDEVKEWNAHVYCVSCLERAKTALCAGCNMSIQGPCIVAMGRRWHKECARCVTCGRTLEGGFAVGPDGLPYCRSDWASRFGSLCFHCDRPIATAAVTARGRSFHIDCFTCSVCHTPLDKTFRMWGERPLCAKDYARLPSAVQKRISILEKLETEEHQKRLKMAKESGLFNMERTVV
eukprot:GCRY01002881.1.p1 GENE.GCRY01002881.1~~GCRY01002881.1.p1  ORF type:complete len:594 (+),score=159.96 GCRY01002881.1:272-2053(+)